MEVVKHNGDALEYASQDLKGNREVVMEAVWLSLSLSLSLNKQHIYFFSLSLSVMHM